MNYCLRISICPVILLFLVTIDIFDEILRYFYILIKRGQIILHLKKIKQKEDKAKI